jgi:hypothetical protein
MEPMSTSETTNMGEAKQHVKIKLDGVGFIGTRRGLEKYEMYAEASGGVGEDGMSACESCGRAGQDRFDERILTHAAQIEARIDETVARMRAAAYEVRALAGRFALPTHEDFVAAAARLEEETWGSRVLKENESEAPYIDDGIPF